VKALVLTSYNHFEICEAPVPPLAPQDVLIAVGACGICGSDVHGMDGSTGRRQPPIIMGHEAAGTVAEVGSAVTAWKPGDRVTFDSTISCGTCGYCRGGRINLCSNRRVLGVSCGEYRQQGAFAEYVAVPEHILYRVPDELSLEHAAMVEPVSVAAHAVERTPVRLGDTAVVVGAGMIGLLCLQVLRARGCGRILVVDLDASRLERARALGADETFCVGTGHAVAESVQAVTGGEGADVVVEAVGVAESVATAVACARKGGVVTLVGNVTPTVPLGLQAAVTRELTLIGSCASSGEYPACLQLMRTGAVQVAPLISAVAPLEEGPEWFHRLHACEPGLIKVLLRPGS
jgi:L-iditol 2-dehydrogenase